MDTEKNDFVKKARTVTPFVETMPADLLTPLGVFLALSSDSENCFLLESVEGGETLVRYSFIGVNPEKIVSGNGKRITIIDSSGERHEKRPMLDFLKQEFAHISTNVSADLPRFIGGAIGYLNFSCVEWFEPTVKMEVEGDEAAFMFFRSIVAFDHAKQVIKIITLVFDHEIHEQKDGVENASRINIQIRNQLETASFVRRPVSKKHSSSQVKSNFNRSDFENAVT